MDSILIWMLLVQVSIAAPGPELLNALQVQQAGEPICAELINFMNTQFTLPVEIGTPAQKLKVVPDTGSRELIIASSKCSDCPTGSGKTQFDASQSSSFVGSDKTIETHFGQGTVNSAVGRDEVAVVGEGGSKLVGAVDVLEMKNQGLRHFDKASFDGVMGMGKQVEARKGDDVPSLLTVWKVDKFGMCFGRNDGTPGIMILNSAPSLSGYEEVSVVGDNHWAVKMTSVSVAGETVCEDGCGAIIDTGTSLFAAPREHLKDLSANLPEVKEDCSNLAELPNFQFTLDDKTFEVPPSVWVIKVKTEEMTDRGWGWFKFKVKTGNLKTVCIPAFMEMNMQSQLGPAWILGMPFMREYAAQFDKTDQKILLAKTGPSTCSSCSNALKTDLAQASTLTEPKEFEPLSIDLNTVRLPPWVNQDENTTWIQL